METELERTKPVAAFMAFGTQGDVYPIAAIAAAFASDQKHYHVVLITHSAHQNLSSHLAGKLVAFCPISSPPVVSTPQNHDATGLQELMFRLKKRKINAEHRKECYSAVERIFGNGPSLEGDFIVINFFALEGWSLAELFRVRCIIASPYVVPYSAPSSFEHCFLKEHPLLYKYLQEAPVNKVCWKDVIHWMWPLFSENWGLWRSEELNLSPCPFTDPVTGLPTWYDRVPSPKLLYGFSKEVVECPDYWPSSVCVCGFWFLPVEWQFSSHCEFQSFLEVPKSVQIIFVGLSSIGSMGFLKNPQAFLLVLRTVLETASYRFILFTAGYEPLDAAIQGIAAGTSSVLNQRQVVEDGVSLFDGTLFCFSGMVPYNCLFPRCVAAIHHGGSGSTAAALYAGIPQILCPFMLDQFYWAERMSWLGVAPEPLKRHLLVPDSVYDSAIKAAAELLSEAIRYALSPEVKACAKEIAERISVEDGMSEAVKFLKEEMGL
ncbi:sterol 3-beta-glucosyltransferase UGT80B1 isoform X3 [Mangifera indica]|uniref:sterol 3-beta-glucosyltransferase UGT80B1 isoform X3 n=1 Tax=Mangifera indica TaxID=29780 RepID=UPI001CF9350C|nr:sterol 3-beta-glucosyltransferase UGT80B1 isoform X3 [Mangifera indica]